MSSWILPQIIGLAALFLLGAFFSAIETALVALPRHRLSHLRDSHRQYARAIQSWLENPNKLLTTMLIGINLVAVGSSALATTVMLNLAALLGWRQDIAVGASTAAVAMIVIMFGEIIPKIVAIHDPERVTLLLLLPLWWIDRVLAPVTGAMVWASNGIIRLFGGKPEGGGSFLTVAEIRALLQTGQEQGVLGRSETEMIHGIFELGDTTAREVMVPRIDITAADAGLTVGQTIKLMERSGRSRVPVYRGTIDNIIGIAYATDINHAVRAGEGGAALADLVRPAHFVPDSKRLDGLLKDFRGWRTHLAIVVDEYGGTAGMVTLEDVLEEIVGDVQDEFDTEEPLYRRLDERTWRIDARIGMEELNEALATQFPTEGFETFGGLIYDLCGKVPAAREKVRWPKKQPQWEFLVEAVRKRRIITVRARRLAKAIPKPRSGGLPTQDTAAAE